ncbi:putative mitochondrial protein [Cucumis melo var. makuwa]|uniref:Mitochondrial protein n=1 Tax=Cucumis melo var. makuwa TaxID=1194695 RepID=A0A5A7TXI6_CUCMM|nr:putative mitochondrial protein [Cucumis melo var. makuwa]
MRAPYEDHIEEVNRTLRIDRKSTLGYCTFVRGNLVTLRSKKQSVMARSSTEIEYRAMNLGIFAISIANNSVEHERTKHVEIDRHFTNERLNSGSICIPYISSSQHIVDVLTKTLLIPNFKFCVSKLTSLIFTSQHDREC